MNLEINQTSTQFDLKIISIETIKHRDYEYKPQ